MTKAEQQRFWQKVDQTNDCWLWTAATDSHGYGTFKSHGSMRGAHRLSYEHHSGPIPVGMEIDHICHVRNCVNPGHLRLATRSQNMENLSGAQSNSKSGIRGVVRRKNRWGAFVHHNGTQHYLGVFDTTEEAAAAVTAARLQLFTHNDADKEMTA